MKKVQICFLSILLNVFQLYAQGFELNSPDGRIKVQVNNSDKISWSASLDENIVIEKAEISMIFSSKPDFGLDSKIRKHDIKSVSSMIYPAVPYKNSEIVDEYNELSLSFKGNYKINFRAYNDGIAYCFVDEGKTNCTVISEKASLTFPSETYSFFPKEESMYSHNECLYLKKPVNEISYEEFCSLPVLFVTPKAKILFTETALYDYPGMFLRGNGNTTMDAIFPKYVLEAVDDEKGFKQNITKEADYIANVSGKRDYPWRVFIIDDDDRTFVESNLTFQLSKPLVIKNTEWIKPGKVAWDWYNANNIYGVDFKSGLNTETYKYYIDFASSHGIEYVILDEGWSKSTNEILDFNPEIDVKELIKYGERKNVGIILWVLWQPLNKDLVQNLKKFKEWGAKGVKVDFLQRSDQYMVNSYENIAKECARLEMIVDFHGSFKPSGLMRMYPNVLNSEGLKGAECNKWSRDITPEHNVTLPFIRMVAGPMDYTPGAMVNKQKVNYTISFERPMSQGTRAHQVAMYVVFEAPLQMLCESPSRYYQEEETVGFISQIPTTWDETIVLKGKIGEYIALARRNGDNWYIGAMTNWDPRELELSLSFLDNGNFQMEVFKDGINATRFGEDYQKEVLSVNNNTNVIAKMAPGGGWVAIISNK
ncbi:MAG: glycoside hydrolase family 97 protein [Mangrovibacterium sp.]|nr:glycoside hydrolase family 97 protein [Mangrovibacterium sp.]